MACVVVARPAFFELFGSIRTFNGDVISAQTRYVDGIVILKREICVFNALFTGEFAVSNFDNKTTWTVRAPCVIVTFASTSVTIYVAVRNDATPIDGTDVSLNYWKRKSVHGVADCEEWRAGQGF